MIDELEGLEGPGTIRVFALILLILAVLAMPATLVAEFYGITFPREIIMSLISRPQGLLAFAGIVSISSLIAKYGPEKLRILDTK